MSCGVGCRHGLDPELLWLWGRLVATAPIGPLAWEPPCASGAALKRKEKKSKSQIMIKGQRTHLQAARLCCPSHSEESPLGVSPCIPTKGSGTRRGAVGHGGKLFCSLGSRGFCLPSMDFPLDQRPRHSLHCLGHVHFLNTSSVTTNPSNLKAPESPL